MANAVVPQIDSELDFFELTRMLGFAAAAIFSFIVAKRYAGSAVFGRAYLSLGIGFSFYFMGELLWYVYVVGYQVINPYPYWPDIGYFLFYPFAIYHLRTNLHFFKRKLEHKEKILLIVLPTAVTLLYMFALLISVSEEPDQQYWNGVYMGSAYVAASTLTFTFALLAARVFRHSILGAPWGLLLLGIGLNWIADMYYYYSSIYYFDRTNPVHGIWLAGMMIVCYALYKHRAL